VIDMEESAARIFAVIDEAGGSMYFSFRCCGSVSCSQQANTCSSEQLKKGIKSVQSRHRGSLAPMRTWIVQRQRPAAWIYKGRLRPRCYVMPAMARIGSHEVGRKNNAWTLCDIFGNKLSRASCFAGSGTIVGCVCLQRPGGITQRAHIYG
jgi:hypothetical protein